MGGGTREIGPAYECGTPLLQSVGDVIHQRHQSAVRADELVAHLRTESLAERPRVGKERDREENVPHAFTLNNRRLRAAASCPSSRWTSALATAMPREVSW